MVGTRCVFEGTKCREHFAVIIDQPIECLAAHGAPLQMSLEFANLGFRQAILGKPPQAVGITGAQLEWHDRPR